MSCCPPGSIGPAPLSKETPKGEMMTIDVENSSNPPMPCYWTGASIASSPRHVVVLFTDVYGLEAGNQKVIADSIVESLGSEAAVMIPDLFRGNPIAQPFSWMPDSLIRLSLPSIAYRIKFQNKPARIESDLKDLIFPWLGLKMEVEKAEFSCIGFCFGGWVVGRALALDELPFKCGVGIHPSFEPEKLHGGKENEVAERIGAKPCLLLPASNDSPMKPNSKVVGIIAEARGVSRDEVSVEFPTMIHGWVARGDSSKEDIAEKQVEALKLTVDFINKF